MPYSLNLPLQLAKMLDRPPKANAPAVKDRTWRSCATRKRWRRTPVSAEKAATPPSRLPGRSRAATRSVAASR
uniref:Uncharacterized protein n=1 Tax=Arundo donax TaxID=35708 RepID=A0A0A8ZGS9_ARUDO